MDAINNPVKRRAREVNTGDLDIGQRPEINLESYERGSEVILPIDSPDGAEYVAQLAFMEEPMTIRIERSSEKFAPKVVDCWVNGRGAELFVNGKWLVCGWLPVGEPIITRRKYVEVLARAKPDSIQTEVTERDGEDPQNTLQRYTSSKYPFSVLQDKNPRGMEWLTRILQEG